MKKYLLVAIPIVAMIAIVMVGYLKKTNTEDKDGALEVQGQNEVEVVKEELPPSINEDTDQDGISNQDEANYRTSSLEADTDGDGISDFDEINTYKTDPTKLDTDGDGFADFIEIMQGFNPNGPGRL